ncbi:AraC-type DNA-binding protein [Chitinophaga sp. CF118]|uniref:helix-turn-helix domain-containing protein n=1 Tax=Chitinophaga sp. CF118 TaxID=1884367 RepID=UPI0008E1A401|nr:AraC family transcriptional regulator [Chitinophaga sp. CF118]SFD23623.1 AraC-type DNA-binding protein [Chitinophaga sp. CF118]
MKYEIIAVPPVLQSFVRCFWTLEGNAKPALSQVFGSLVDGRPGLIFQDAAAGTLIMEDKQLPDLFLYGQTTKHTEIMAAGTFRATGVMFHPHALKSVFGMNAAELTNSCIDPDQVSVKKSKGLSMKLAEASSVEEQVKILKSYLQTQISNKRAHITGIVEYAVSQILTSNGNISLKDLQEDLQITEKSLERKFKDHVGIPPKLFSGICRYQASLHQLRNNQYNKLSDIAYENDYADQSHFIRSFKKYTGCSPFQFQKQFSPE